MSTAHGWRQYTEVRTDWRAVGLVTLFAIVFAGSLLIYPWFLNNGTDPVVSGASTAEQAGGGLLWALAEALFAGALVAGILLYRKVTPWVQLVIRKTAIVGFWSMLALYAATVTGGLGGFIGVVAFYALTEAAKEQHVYWLINDVLALAGAVLMAAAVGIILGPVVIGVGLVGFAVYDHWFADRKTWMWTLAHSTLRWKLPMLFVVPLSLQFDWDEFVDGMRPDEDNDGQTVTADDVGLGFGIRMADLLLPAAFAVGVASAGGGLPVLGIVAGTLVACFRLSHKMHRQSGAGMPALTTGAVGGWGIAFVLLLIGGA